MQSKGDDALYWEASARVAPSARTSLWAPKREVVAILMRETFTPGFAVDFENAVMRQSWNLSKAASREDARVILSALLETISTTRRHDHIEPSLAVLVQTLASDGTDQTLSERMGQGTYGTVLISLTSRILRFACH